MALGLGLYIIPLALVANPSLIALEETPTAAIIAFLQIGVFLGMISYGVIAPLKPVLRALLVALGAVGIFVIPFAFN